MIKICVPPSIVQATDRWGQLLDEYYVEYYCGFVEEEMWEDIQKFEGYNNTELGRQEMQSVADAVKIGLDMKDIPDKS